MMPADRSSASHPPAPSELRRASPPELEERRRVGAEALRRLRWRARRGLLENDLLIGRFLERYADALDAADAAHLALLLDLSDTDLLELLLGRRQPAGDLDIPAVRNLLTRLRSNT